MRVLVALRVMFFVVSLVLAALTRSRCTGGRSAAARVELSSFHAAIEEYLRDEGHPPGAGAGPCRDGNDFPRLYRALFGRRWPAGPGGRSAPYARLYEANVGVRDEALGEYRVATRDEILDDAVDKYLFDPFGEPYVYRVLPDGAGRPPRFDLYSKGPDGLDDGAAGEKDNDIRIR